MARAERAVTSVVLFLLSIAGHGVNADLASLKPDVIHRRTVLPVTWYKVPLWTMEKRAQPRPFPVEQGSERGEAKVRPRLVSRSTRRGVSRSGQR